MGAFVFGVQTHTWGSNSHLTGIQEIRVRNANQWALQE